MQQGRMVALGSQTFLWMRGVSKPEISFKFNAPAGTVQSTTSFGATGFGGPCGVHCEPQMHLHTVCTKNRQTGLDAANQS
jgi:hypothetical protein